MPSDNPRVPGALEEERRRYRRPRRGVRDPRPLRFHARLARPEYQSALKSGKPQCVFKNIGGVKGSRMKDLIKYISREGKANENPLPFESSGGAMYQGKDDIQALYEDWRRDFERKKPGRKREPRHVTHLMLSSVAGNSPAEVAKVNMAAREFLKKNFADLGYEYVFATHDDSDHAHVHIAIKNFNRLTGKKLHLSKAATFDLREQWAQELAGHGIEAVATMRRDRPEVLRSVAEGIGHLKARDSWSENKMRSAPADLTFKQRKGLARRVVRMKAQVKAVTLPGSEDRRRYMAALRELDRSLREESRERIASTARATLSTIGRDLQGLRKDLFELASRPEAVADARHPKAEAADRRQASRRTALAAKAVARDIEVAARHLKAARLPAAEREQLAAYLKAHRSALRELVGRGGQVRSRGRILEAKAVDEQKKTPERQSRQKELRQRKDREKDRGR